MHLRAAVFSFALATSLAAHGAPNVTELEAARTQANARFHAADARVKEVGVTLSQASESFRGCHNGALQFQFTGALTSLEKSRRTLEKGRKEAQALRKSLEGARSRLEAAHARRNAPTRPEALANEQVYLERLLTEYVRPLNDTLVPLIDGYTSGITAYSQALTRYAELCARPGYTGAAGAAFVTGLQAELDALTGKSEQLVTQATEARKASAGSALSAN